MSWVKTEIFGLTKKSAAHKEIDWRILLLCVAKHNGVVI